MNILIMNLAHDGGGAEAVARQTYNFGKVYDDVNTYFLAGRGRLFQGYDVIYPRRTPQKYFNLFMCALAHNQRFHDGYALRKIKRLIKKYQIDILHIHNLHGGYIGIDDIKELSKVVKIVWTLHDMWTITGHCAYTMDKRGNCEMNLRNGCANCPRLDAYAPLTKDIAKECLQRKSHSFAGCDISFVTPSRWLKEEVQRGIFKDEKIQVIENGVDTTVYKPFESDNDRQKFLAERGIDSDRIVLFFVAHELDNPYKGADVLVEALNKVDKKDKFALIVAGKGEHLQLNSTYQTFYTGYISSQEEMSRYYGCADAFVIPSCAENYPCTVIEAMSSGTPVIGSNAGGIPEQITEKTGYVFENGNSYQLAEILNGLNKNDLAGMRVECRNRAEDVLSQSIMYEKYYDLYQKLLADV